MALKAHCHPECIAAISRSCHLGNNSQSENCIQQMKRSKTKTEDKCKKLLGWVLIAWSLKCIDKYNVN